MADLMLLSAQKRENTGKGANRRSRQEDVIPGVFYSAIGDNIAIQIPLRALAKVYAQVKRTTVFNLEIEDNGKKAIYPALVWQVQRDPVKNSFTHIDFYGVDLDKPVKVTVPVEFTGTARGTKVGGKLETYREEVRLIAKPLEMPARVVVDVTPMDLGTTIHVADLALPEGVSAAYDANYAIVSVLIPGGTDEE